MPHYKPHLEMLLIMCSLDMFSCVDSGKGDSLEIHFGGNAIKLSKSNVSRSVVGLRHFTRNVSAICIMLSVSTELLKLWIRNIFYSYQCCKFGRDLAIHV